MSVSNTNNTLDSNTNLEALTDAQLLDYARGAYSTTAEVAIRNHRAETGRILTEMFRRYEKRKEEGETRQTWDEICLSIPIARKTAFNLRNGYATISEADSLILAAAAERKIDLFQPATNKILREINKLQAGQPVTPEQLEKYLLQLDPPELSDNEKEKRKAEASSKKSAEDDARQQELRDWLNETGSADSVSLLLDTLRPVITGFLSANRKYSARQAGEMLALLAVGDIKPRRKADDDVQF